MVGIALIGTGRIGQIHAKNIVMQQNFRLLRVVDIDSEASRKVASQFGAEVSDLQSVMEDSDISGVIIASSTPTHAAYIMAACDAGKSIFCEKPIDLDYGTAHKCAQKVASTKSQFLMGFNRRFDPHFSRLKEKIDSGEIGRVETIHITSHDPAPPPIDYIQTSGGLFKDMTIHDFDIARWLLDEEPVEVHAFGSALVDQAIAAVGDIDTAKIILRTESGRLCVISNCRRAAYGYDQRVEVFGSAGTLRLDNVPNRHVSAWTEKGCVSSRPQHFFLERYCDAYKNEMAHFADVIAGTAESRVTVDDGLAAIRLAEAAGSSLQHGLPARVADTQ